MNPLTNLVTTEFGVVGLKAELLSERYFSELFGNAIVVFRFGSMLLKFLRDRSQDTLEIAPNAYPKAFYPFFIVEIAMGWTKLDDNYFTNYKTPPIRDTVGRLATDIEALNEVFSGDLAILERARDEYRARSPLLQRLANLDPLLRQTRKLH